MSTLQVRRNSLGSTKLHLEQMLDVLRNWNEPVIRYAPSNGSPEFLEACVGYYHKIGHPFVTKQNMVVGVGASECLQWVFFGICQPGEEILVFEPFYSNYSAVAAMVGITLTPVPTSIENGFHLPSKQEIEKYINQKTKGILYTNPGIFFKEKFFELIIFRKPYRNCLFQRRS